MDNLSHSLVGLIAGESIARGSRARQSGLPPDTRRGLLVTLSVVGGNLPDIDLVYSYHPFSHGTQAKLDYMLQHRGYTHTVVVCFVLSALLYGAAEIWARRLRLVLTGYDRLLLAGTALFGVLLHLGMDFLNSYGVHPFWPLDNRWLYGDSVFIVEPLYWAASLGLFFLVRSPLARVAVAVAPILGLLAGMLLQRATPVWCAGYAVLAVAMLFVGMRTQPVVAALASAAVAITITAVFVIAGGVAARRVAAIAAADFSGDRVIDHVLTPAPMNPLCWDVLLLEARGDRYAVRLGTLSLAPAFIPAQRCPRTSGTRRTTAGVMSLPAAASPEIQWSGEFAMSRALLARLVAGHCQVAAAMHFIRAPFGAQVDDQWVIGDLRFDRERGGGLASIDLGPSTHGECPSTVPWTPPRADLLDVKR